MKLVLNLWEGCIVLFSFNIIIFARYASFYNVKKLIQ